MNIAMLASEALPLSKTGGLADVVYALSKELAKDPKNEVIIFTPNYRNAKINAFPSIFLGVTCMRIFGKRNSAGFATF